MNSWNPNFTLIIGIASSILMLIALSTSDNSKDKEECTESLVGLATCLPYVGGTAKSPTPDCCNGLKQVLKTNKKCLCVIIKDRNDPDLGLTINVTLALGLPDVCNAPANISQCPALLHLPPNSPDAQIFYQLGKKSSNNSSSALSPAGGPNPNVGLTPTSRAAGAGGAAAGGNSQPKSGGCRKGKREIMMSGLVLLLCLIIIMC